MKGKKIVVDLYCGAGGASVGISRAGYEVIGVDNQYQPSYPYTFIKMDAIKFMIALIDEGVPLPGRKKRLYLKDVEWFWASPPCQSYSWSAKRWISGALGQKKRKYPDMIGRTRTWLKKTGKPYIIENVAGAPLKNKIMLCGLMFDLEVNRHRYFESNLELIAPHHQDCRGRIASGEALTVAGHGGNSKSYKLEDWRLAMGIDWMDKRPHNLGSRKNPGNREDLCESIPPAYSEYLAEQVGLLMVVTGLALAI